MNNTQISQIAERLRGLRESLELTPAQLAEKTGVDEKDYVRYESGKSDIPISFIFQVAQILKVETTALIAGDEPRASSFFVTRKEKGISVERSRAYKYHALAAGFKSAVAEPFEVMVEPNDYAITLNTHVGQEFNYVLEGSMQMQIGANTMILEEGDSIYFDATKPHGMKALNGKIVRFLAVIVA